MKPYEIILIIAAIICLLIFTAYLTAVFHYRFKNRALDKERERDAPAKAILMEAVFKWRKDKNSVDLFGTVSELLITENLSDKFKEELQRYLVMIEMMIAGENMTDARKKRD